VKNEVDAFPSAVIVFQTLKVVENRGVIAIVDFPLTRLGESFYASPACDSLPFQVNHLPKKSIQSNQMARISEGRHPTRNRTS
jgi:hypothetical protein